MLNWAYNAGPVPFRRTSLWCIFV